MIQQSTFFYHTTWQRLKGAVLSLASGNENLLIRLEHSWLDLHPLKIEDFPADLQKEFEEILKAFGEFRIPSDGTLVIDDTNAEKLAEKILNLYDLIAREYCSGDPIFIQ
jgi:hypothetical protein